MQYLRQEVPSVSEDLSSLSDKELLDLYHRSKAGAVVFNLSQQAKKILLNSCYGAIGNAYFLHNDVRIARAITLAGQAMINKSAKETNDWLNGVLKNREYTDYRVYSDTDSNYFDLDDALKKFSRVKPDADRRDKADFLDKFCQKIESDCLSPLFDKVADEVNGIKSAPLHMDREAIAVPNEKTGHCGIWIAKKRYYLLLDDMEGFRYTANGGEPHEKIMGLFSVTSTCPEFVKPWFNRVLHDLVAEGVEKARETIAEFRKLFFAKPVSEISFQKGVSDMDKFLDPETNLPWDGQWTDKASGKVRNGGCPINAKAAIYHNHLVDKLNLQKTYQKIKSGDKMKYAYLKENPYHWTVIGFQDDIPEEFGLKEYVDIQTHYEKIFYKPIEDVFKACGLDIEPKVDIASFF